MVKTSISTTFNYDIPIDEQLVLIKEAGFTYVSLGMNYDHSRILDDGGAEKLAIMIDKSGLKVDTIHGYDLDQEDALLINEKLAVAAKTLDTSVIVVHCSSFWFPDTEFEKKKEIVSTKIERIEELAKQYQIRFAFENVVPGSPTKLCEEMIRMANPEYVGFCYDSSHDQIDGPNNMDLLNRMKDRVIAVHMSDRIKEFVDHVVPVEGFIHFDEIIPILKEIRYNSPMLMEVEMTHSQYKDVKEFLRQTHTAALYLAELEGNRTYSSL